MALEVTFQMTGADYVAANRDWFLRAISPRCGIKHLGGFARDLRFIRARYRRRHAAPATLV